MIANKMTLTSLKNHKDYKVNYEMYESTAELVEICEGRTKMPDFDNDSFGGKYNGDKSWRGLEGIGDAKKYLREGWSDHVDKLLATMNGLKQTVDGKRVSFQNNVMGYAPIVPLALLNIPNSMIDIRMKPMKSKIIDVYYDTTMSCGNSAEEIKKCGLKVMSAIIRLEHEGYRVRLSAVQAYSDSRDCDLLVTRVKSENQPLDLKRIMFPTLHPAMFRVVGFGWYERLPTGRHRSGYGHALQYEMKGNELDCMIKEMFGKTAIYLSATAVQSKDEDYVVATLKGTEDGGAKN